MEEQISNNNNDLQTSTDTKKFIATPDMVQEWKKMYLKEGHSVGSATTYFNYIKSFVDYGIEINQKSVDKFRSKSSSGASAGALKNFFNFLVKKKGFPMEIRGIYFDKSKSTKKFPESLDPIEVQKIIDSMGEISLKDKVFTLVMANLGLRISECMKLKYEDFNFISWLQDKTKQGSVNLKNTKGGKFRTIPVPKDIMELLFITSPQKTSEGLPMGKDSPLVFDFGLNDFKDRENSSPEEKMFAYLKYAGDRYRRNLNRVTRQLFSKNAHPHMFRHYKAQDLMNRGLDISSLQLFLGHQSISSTQIYAQSSSIKLAKDIEELDKK